MNNNHINIVWCCRRSPAPLFLIMIFRDFSGFFRIFRDFSGFLKYRCLFFKVKSLQMIKHILIWFSDCPRANYYTYQPLERDLTNITGPCVVQILTVVGERSLNTRVTNMDKSQIMQLGLSIKHG